MSLVGLDHYTVNCADLDRAVRFYEDVLGLRRGDRPPFSFPGAWLYLDDVPVVHLVAGRERPGEGNGSFDHLAFRAEDFDGICERLRHHEVTFEARTVPRTGARQIFLSDADGVRIELNFR